MVCVIRRRPCPTSEHDSLCSVQVAFKCQVTGISSAVPRRPVTIDDSNLLVTNTRSPSQRPFCSFYQSVGKRPVYFPGMFAAVSRIIYRVLQNTIFDTLCRVFGVHFPRTTYYIVVKCHCKDYKIAARNHASAMVSLSALLL